MEPKGKVVVVTGATSGLGQAVAVDLAKAGASVIIVGRDAARAEETLALARTAGGDAKVVLGDLSTRAGARTAAAAILALTDRIDVLINNAGGSFKTPSSTADGLDASFAVNTLGPYILERELHGALAKAHGRVVNVVTGFLGSFPVDPDDLVAPRKWRSMSQYGRAKHASLMMTVEQARLFAPDNVSAVALHPGIIMGTRFGGGQPKVAQIIGGPIMRAFGLACSMDEAVRRFRVAAFGDVDSAAYIVKGRPAPLPKQSQDKDIRARVVALLDRLAIGDTAPKSMASVP